MNMARAIWCLLKAVFLIEASLYPISAWETDAAIDPLLRMARPDSLELILETGRTYTITWRPRMVHDLRRRNQPEIPAEREWLCRWDRHHPRDIFPTGFRPRVDIEGLVYGMINPATDLRGYVANNHESVFVSTTRSAWGPRGRGGVFRYDIFAPGGIVVNPTLGQHQFQSQMEVAFFGGIRTDYIYRAVEHDENGRQLRYHLNPLYRGPENPLAGRRVCQLPVVYYTRMRPARQNYCTVPRSTRKKRSSNTDPMRTVGSTLPPLSDCSYWYKVEVMYLSFDQPAEVGQIEPYGSLDVYVTNGFTNYAISSVWKYYPRSSAPSVKKDTKLRSLAKCLVVQSDTNSNTVKVCFDGYVWEYDSLSGDDEIAVFHSVCKTTSPNRNPSKLYTKRFTGKEGSLTIGFKVTPCDQNCIKDKLSGSSHVNGVC